MSHADRVSPDTPGQNGCSSAPEATDVDRLRRVYLSTQRDALRAPIHAIIDVSRRLLSDAADPDQEELYSDMQRIHDSGTQLLALIDEVLAPDYLERATAETGFEAAQSMIRHDFLNKLNPILNYTDMWIEDSEHFVEGLRADLVLIRTAAQRCHALVDAVLRFSESAEVGELEAPGAFREMESVVSRLFRANAGPARERLRGRLLVADDNDINRDILTRRLQAAGHEVVGADNGRQVLQLIETEPFDAILLDIVMPGVSGFEVLCELKQDSRYRDVPIIMISALEEIDLVAKCIEMGADDYLSKPFNPVVLHARIEACLEKTFLRRREQENLAQIEAERKRADDLLHVILPSQIVAELKRTSGVAPRRYERVAIMFADIVGFTRYCEHHSPDHVVEVLQRLVSQWEEIALRYQVQKIKTIGDAFMAACGLFAHVDNPVLNCVRCGQEMIEATQALGIGWDLRVGVNYGSAVGGILGRRQYLFDLWGDAVNIAARMESHGLKGSVVLSADACEAVRTDCQAESLGEVPIKGKGRMEVFRVDAPHAALAPSDVFRQIVASSAGKEDS